MEDWATTLKPDYLAPLDQSGDSLFRPQDGHHGIDIALPRDGKPQFTHVVLAEDQVVGWVTSTAPHGNRDQKMNSFCLRMLLSAPLQATANEQDESASLVPMPLSRATYRQIEQSFHLHCAYLPILCEKTPVWSRFIVEDERLQDAIAGGGSAEHFKGTNFVIRDNVGYAQRSASSFTYLPKDNITYGMIQGLQSNEVQNLLDRLQQCLPLTSSPTLIPFLLLRRRFENTVLRIKILANNVHHFEQTTRMLQEMSIERVDVGALKQNEYKWKSVGRGLSTFSEEVAHLAYGCDIDLRLLEFLDEIDSWIEEHSSEKTQASRERTSLLRSWLQSTQSRITYLEKRAQAQVQTLYSLIAQRDNAVSIQLAEASKATAEASLRDNQTMKQLAEDSKNIAAATQKDSAAMRTIAVVTAIFLPGTFTASVFSANFLNLQPRDDSVVSRWVWVYVGLTLFLTCAVLIGYWVPMRRKAQEIDRLVSEDSKEKVS